jgi:hypothetical protein
MKKLCLLIALVTSPVFAQEEEQEIQIEIETGGGVEVGMSASGMGRAIAAYPDKSVWFRSFDDADDPAIRRWGFDP